jgi:hypothetical protein
VSPVNQQGTSGIAEGRRQHEYSSEQDRGSTVQVKTQEDYQSNEAHDNSSNTLPPPGAFFWRPSVGKYGDKQWLRADENSCQPG